MTAVAFRDEYDDIVGLFSYDGDLMDDERILEWLTSQDVIEVG